MDTIQNDLKTFHALQPNKKLAIIGIFALVFIISIAVGIIMRPKTGAPTTPPSGGTPETTTGKAALTLTADTTQATVGKALTVRVALEKVPVQAVDVFLNYDATLFKASDIKNGTIYEPVLDPEITEKNDAGVLYYSGSVDTADPTNIKTGDIFSFTLTPLKKGTGTISFEIDVNKKTVTAKNGVNILGTAEPLSITVK